jgi:ribosomal protein S16
MTVKNSSASPVDKVKAVVEALRKYSLVFHLAQLTEAVRKLLESQGAKQLQEETKCKILG